MYPRKEIKIPSRYVPQQAKNTLELLEYYYEYLKGENKITNPRLMKYYLEEYDQQGFAELLTEVLLKWGRCPICSAYTIEKVGGHADFEAETISVQCMSAICAGGKAIREHQYQEILADALELRDIIEMEE